ncbi:MAG: META domain-containing protein [Saprospiraceae bacterium]|nr:META domain-containing protein [Saprospiraceae bacterium]
MKNILGFALLLAGVYACNGPQKCIERLDPACSCMMLYDPVCGCNNKTYSNACMAECSGIKTYAKGSCLQDASKLEGVVWRLSTFAISPEPLQVPDDVTITAEFKAGKVNGKGGCNQYGGDYMLDGNSLKISALFSTKMFCEKTMNLESRYFQQLEKSQSYSINGKTLEINCGVMGNLIFQSN